MRKLTPLFLALFLVTALFVISFANAATFDEINESSMFFKQSATGDTAYQCTLFAATSMVRRAARLNGNGNYVNITPANMQGTAWVSAGLRNSFSYEGVSVGCGSLPQGSSNIETVKNLLANHPEGIVIYGHPGGNSNQYHAVLLTDYTDGVFYVADSGNLNLGIGRVTFDYNYSKATSVAMKIEHCFKYWYVTSSVTPPQPNDIIPPQITSAYITNVSSSGYDVVCTYYDNVGVTKVQCPTWTNQNGQDDIFSDWWSNPRASATLNNGTATYRVNVSDHNNERNCYYTTHLYAYDAAGNYACYTLNEVYIDGNPPVLSDAYISNITGEGYDVVVSYNDDVGIARVQFPTWTSPNDQDDLISDWVTNTRCSGVIDNGTATYHVSIGDHGNQTGCDYITHIYAFDSAGNQSECIGLSAYIPFVPTQSWTEVSTLPQQVNEDDYEIQYKNSYSTVAASSPGAGWTQTGYHSSSYEPIGATYESDMELATSETRRLVSYYYYHYCGASHGVNADHTIRNGYVHWDAINDSSLVTEVKRQEDDTDAGYYAYILDWKTGGRAYCNSNTTCDGSNGTHGNRAYYWYRRSTYQDYQLINYYNWSRESDWTDAPDAGASIVHYRYRHKAVPITEISLDVNKLEITEGESVTLTATIIPENAFPNDVLWTSDDQTVATVENGVITTYRPGATYIQCISSENGEVSATVLLVVHAENRLIIPQGTQIIEQDAFNNDINIREVDLPAGLQRIDSGAFAGCTNLMLIVEPGGTVEIRSGAFEGCSNADVLTVNNSSMMDMLMFDFATVRKVLETSR